MSTAVALSVALPSSGRADPPFSLPHDLLYIESNSTIAGKNAVLGYHRAADGSLTPLPGSPFLTSGTGWFDPTYAVGPFDADGIMAYDPIGRVLFVPNGGSKSVAALYVNTDGSLLPVGGSPFAVHGNTPDALALRGSNLVIVDNGGPPGSNSGPTGFESAYVTPYDQLALLPQFTVQRIQGTVPTQALPLPGTPLVFTNEFALGKITSYYVDQFGAMTELSGLAVPQESTEASQPKPIGLALSTVGRYLYVGLPNVGRVAVFTWNDGGILSFVRSVPVSGAAPCWIHVSKSGRFVYVVDTASDAVSVLDASNPANPVEIQLALLRDAPGFSDQIAASPDEKFLYTVEEEGMPAVAGLSNKIHILSVNQTTGMLTEIAASPVKLPVPAHNRPQGLVVF
jgi:DNA-binding beta-propeller fold protein YncE